MRYFMNAFPGACLACTHNVIDHDISDEIFMASSTFQAACSSWRFVFGTEVLKILRSQKANANWQQIGYSHPSIYTNSRYKPKVVVLQYVLVCCRGIVLFKCILTELAAGDYKWSKAGII